MSHFPSIGLELRQVLVQVVVQRQELVLRQTLVGGATSSIFTHTARLLHSSSRHQNAIEALVSWRAGMKYRSLIDFLFCELFPEWKDPCRWFYRDEGPKLQVYLTEDTIRRFDLALVAALELAVEFKRIRRCGWPTFKREFAVHPAALLTR